MRADRTGGPVEQSRAAVGWRPASKIAGRRDVVRCRSCQFGEQTGPRWRCTRNEWATTANATCTLARHRGEPHQETRHD